jgi:hypothetical protein
MIRQEFLYNTHHPGKFIIGMMRVSCYMTKTSLEEKSEFTLQINNTTAGTADD